MLYVKLCNILMHTLFPGAHLCVRHVASAMSAQIYAMPKKFTQRGVDDIYISH